MMDHHLGRMVQARWRARFPDEPVEVINLSMVAINSHALREFAREAVALDPDMFVIYAGHNEAIGPFGPAAKFGPAISSPALARLALAVRRTRVGRAVESAIGAVSPSGRESEGWRGLDEFRGVRVAQDDPALEAMLRNTEENFRAITRMALDHGAKVLFCLPATNLTDWPPLASEEPDRGGVEAVFAAQEAGGLGSLRSAALIYEAARQCKDRGDWDRAWPLYRRAADLDLQRFRADTAVLTVQEKIASDSGPDVGLVDAGRWLHEMNPRFTTDRDFFLEHVHLTMTGRAAVAELIVDGMAELWGLGPVAMNPDAAADWWAGFPESERGLREDIFFTGYDEHDMWSLAWKLLGLGVFADSPGLAQRREELAAKTTELQRRAVLDWDTPALVAAYEVAARRNPDDPVLHFTAGRLLGMRGEGERAEEAFSRGFALRPADSEGRLNHAAFQLQRGRSDLARESLQILRSSGEENSGLLRMEAAIALREGDRLAAVRHLRQYLHYRPGDEDARQMLQRIEP
jgi:tetratricopeptide (TPR) repeat protein